MKKYLPLLIIAGLLMIAFSSVVTAQEKKAKLKYEGLTACKTCHSKDSIGGTEYTKFATGPHGKAFETLKNDESKAIAAKMGIEDASKSPKCLKCHVTAYGKEDQHGEKFKYEEGVTCEACHGPGEKYKPMPIMRDHEAAIKNGLIVPDKKVCIECHNEESPTYVPFDFAKKWAQIKHGKKKADAK